MDVATTRRSQTQTETHSSTQDSDPLWYKDAVIYQLHIKSFFDANGDGIGDFEGLHEKLDHIASLGANVIWLLPFFPSPRRDDGYDIADYTNVSSDYGTMEEFEAFVEAAHQRGLRVVIELVINHTSDQHPWFQRARHAPRRFAGARILRLVGHGSEVPWKPGSSFLTLKSPTGPGTLVAGAYYWHRFYSHQPDLNFDNPLVLKAASKRDALAGWKPESMVSDWTQSLIWSSARGQSTRTCQRRMKS